MGSPILMPKTNRTLIKTRVIQGLIAVLFGLTVFFIYGTTLFLPPNPAYQGEPILVAIPIGSSTRTIAGILKEKGIIKDPLVFRLAAKWSGRDGKLMAGEYELTPAMSLDTLLSTLTTGIVQEQALRFTIPEGYTLKEMAAVFAAKGLFSEEEFMRAANSDQIPLPAGFTPQAGTPRLEGYLFPDTYEVKTGASPEEVIRKMVDRLAEKFTPAMQERAKQLGMTPSQVITLASIIEEEAKKDEERAIISSVFHNRLKKGWKLESCATVQYALGKHKEVLYDKDLEVESPYNTYKYAGLPPGPISAPGIASIEAALYPAQTDYLFFVAKKDGSHIFSRTFAEHQRAIREANR